MSAYDPFLHRAANRCAPQTEWAGAPCESLPSATCAHIAAQQGRQFQSSGGFATQAFIAQARAANRRHEALFTRIYLAVAAVAGAWAVLPALCMWLAGGTPA